MKYSNFYGVEHDYDFFQTGPLFDEKSNIVLYGVYGIYLDMMLPFSENSEFKVCQDLIDVERDFHAAYLRADCLNKKRYEELYGARNSQKVVTSSD